MLKNKRISAGFYFLITASVFAILGVAFYGVAYSIFEYAYDRLALSLTIVSVWLIGFLLIDAIFTRDNPKFSMTFYALAFFMLTYSVIRFITPCLTPIGIIFTVGNMGDYAKTAAATNYCLFATGFYIVSLHFLFVGTILGTTRNARKKAEDEVCKEQISEASSAAESLEKEPYENGEALTDISDEDPFSDLFAGDGEKNSGSEVE